MTDKSEMRMPAVHSPGCSCSWWSRVYRRSAETLWQWDDHVLTAVAALRMMTTTTTCRWWRHTTSRYSSVR